MLSEVTAIVSEISLRVADRAEQKISILTSTIRELVFRPIYTAVLGQRHKVAVLKCYMKIT